MEVSGGTVFLLPRCQKENPVSCMVKCNRKETYALLEGLMGVSCRGCVPFKSQWPSELPGLTLLCSGASHCSGRKVHWSRNYWWGKNRRNKPFRRKKKENKKTHPNQPTRKKKTQPNPKPNETFDSTIKRWRDLCYQSSETKKSDQVPRSCWLNRDIYFKYKYAACNCSLRMSFRSLFSPAQSLRGNKVIYCWLKNTGEQHC